MGLCILCTGVAQETRQSDQQYIKGPERSALKGLSILGTGEAMEIWQSDQQYSLLLIYFGSRPATCCDTVPIFKPFGLSAARLIDL